MTRKDYYTRIMEVVSETQYEDTQELMDFLAHQLEIISRPSSKSTKMTEAQLENEGIKDRMVAVIRNAAEPISIPQIQTADPDLASYSNQKMSTLLSQLVKAGVLERGKDGRTTVFSLSE
ncbi:MAG: hypothetical protein LUD47_07440 [Clostridia bacterium]|nr:hypothetical protein [Clostridia bacterium]